MQGSRVLADRYELGALIGRGGMGAVYRGHDRVLSRPVAVKLLPAGPAGEDQQARADLLREARAAAALSHPAVVAVFDSGVDDGEQYLVMELVEGRSLDAILRGDGALDSERASQIAAAVAGALAAAHAAGIVHRDIKPANVMIREDGQVKVLDFGIARLQDATLTRDGLLGTAAYMAPERALGGPADARADIYSLGCLLYAMLTGEPPFGTENAAALIHKHATLMPAPARTLQPSIPRSLDALTMGMLAKDPAQRPQTAAEVRDALQSEVSRARFGAADATERDSAMLAAAERTERAERAERTAVLPPRGPRADLPGLALGGTPVSAVRSRRRRRIMLAAAVAALLLAAIVLAATGSPSTKRTATRHKASTVTVTLTTQATTVTVPATTAAAGNSGEGGDSQDAGFTPPGQAAKGAGGPAAHAGPGAGNGPGPGPGGPPGHDGHHGHDHGH